MADQARLHEDGGSGNAAIQLMDLRPQALRDDGVQAARRQPVQIPNRRAVPPRSPSVFQQPEPQQAVGAATPPRQLNMAQQQDGEIHPQSERLLPRNPEPSKWRAWQLEYWLLSIMLLLEIALIACLAALMRLSRTRKGFVAVSERVPVSFGIGSSKQHQNLSLSFLWTTIPTLFMTLFSLLWGSIVGAYAFEVPFRVLGGGGTLQHTVCLDYRRYPTFYNWAVAWKNRHILLGFCMFFALLCTIALVPLAAHLFQVTVQSFTESGDFSQESFYNQTRLQALIDYQSVIGIVSAVRVYGGSWPTWTDGMYAVPAFNRIVNDQAALNVTQYQIDTVAVSATVDCVNIPSYSLSRTPGDGDTATIALNATDRGCNFSLTAGVGPGNPIYLKMVSTTDCGDNNYSRISYLAGAYSAASTYLLDRIQVISCIPSYMNINGIVEIPPSFLPLAFQPSNTSTPTDARPDNWRLFEGQLIALSNIGDNNAPDFTSQFGNLILDMIDTSLQLDSDTLISTTEIAFSSAFAILARTRLYQATDPAETVSGTLVYSQTRLATVPWSASTSIAIVGVLFILTLLLIVVIGRQDPILAEEPHGILGAAAVLHNSDLSDVLRQGEWKQTHQGRFQDWLDASYHLDSARCRYRPSLGIQLEHELQRKRPQQNGVRH